MYPHMKLPTLLALGALAAVQVATGANTLLVDSSNSSAVSTSFNLLAGHTYAVQVQGTFTYNMFLTDWSTTYMADADWMWNQATQDGSWTERWPDSRTPDYFMHLLVNGQDPLWLGTTDLTPGPNSVFTAHTFSPSHVYEAQVVGQGAPISFLLYDSPYWYDNVGNLTLSITEVPEPGSCALLGLGVAMLGMLRHRRS